MKRSLAFAAIATSATIFATLLSLAPIGRFVSKTESALYDRLGQIFLDEVLLRLALVFGIVLAALSLRATRPRLAMGLLISLIPLTWLFDMIVWQAT